MGALHEGHLSLIRRAMKENDRTVVSLFVNPLQFGPREDFRRYPRPFGADCKTLRVLGVDAALAPSVARIYPQGFQSFAEVPYLSRRLCGLFRPGHFRGVATVVLKLFNLVGPDRAYFGEKDYQQLQVVRRMVRDLDLPLRVVACPTVRAADGLALSSRNRYLSPSQRRQAIRIFQALRLGRRLLRRHSASEVLRQVRRFLVRQVPSGRIEYVEFVHARTLEPLRRRRQGVPSRLLAALWLGKTRLIDNIAV